MRPPDEESPPPGGAAGEHPAPEVGGASVPKIARFVASGSVRTVGLATSLLQVVEVRDSEELLTVEDPSRAIQGYVRWSGQPVPVLRAPEGAGETEQTGRKRIVLLRGARLAKVVALPIREFRIESLDAAGGVALRGEATDRTTWGVPALARLTGPFGEALLLDMDGLIRSLVV